MSIFIKGGIADSCNLVRRGGGRHDCAVKWSENEFLSGKSQWKVREFHFRLRVGTLISVSLLLGADSALVYASSWNKFCSVSSPAEDTVDFPCEDSKSSAVEEQKVNCKPPCFVNSYWFNALCSKLQCYRETSWNQTADQYRMEDDSLNWKAGSSSYWSRLVSWPKWTEIAPNVAHCPQKCGTFELKVRQNYKSELFRTQICLRHFPQKIYKPYFLRILSPRRKPSSQGISPLLGILSMFLKETSLYIYYR